VEGIGAKGQLGAWLYNWDVAVHTAAKSEKWTLGVAVLKVQYIDIDFRR